MSGNNYYALTIDILQTDYLAGRLVTVSGNTLTASSVDTGKMVWTFTADGDGYDIKNGANYLNRTAYAEHGHSNGLYISANEAAAPYSDWLYNASNLYVYSINGSVNFNLVYAGDYFKADYETTQEIYLYKFVESEPVTLESISAVYTGGAVPREPHLML